MFKYLKAVWYFCTGRFNKARRVLMENEYVMGATYDNAIKKAEQRLGTSTEAVAELMSLAKERTLQVNALQTKFDTLTKAQAGAKVAMQRTIDKLKSEGKTKEQIQASAEFLKPQAAFNDATTTLANVSKELEEKKIDLEKRNAQIATFKAQLQKIQKSGASLKEEREEALADVAIAKSMEAIDSQLAGLTVDSADEELKEAREARNRAKTRAEIKSELAGNDASLAENEYIQLAAESEASSQLDNMLNWGESDQEELSPAKLPE
jgi:phage shock protein A